MTIKELQALGKCPLWLAQAVTEHAEVTVDQYGWVTWYSGNFLGGDFLGGDFLGGDFRGGDFRGGDFRGGDFRGGDFRGGNFLGGNFLGGDFLGGDFRGGDFRGGDFRGGNFLGGNFLGGTVCKTKPSKILTLSHCDGWPKTLCAVDGVAYILAGCRFFTIADARKHWSKRKGDRATTIAMLNGIEAVAKLWKLKLSAPKSRVKKK